MQRSISSKALSLFMTLLLALGTFSAAAIGLAATVSLASPTAYATATPGGTGNLGVELSRPGQYTSSNYIAIEYDLTATGALFTGSTCNWQLKASDVTLTKTDGGATLNPQGIELGRRWVTLYFPVNMALGEYTVSFKAIEGVDVTFKDYHDNIITVLPWSAKPVITFGALANGEVPVTVSAANTNGITPYLNIRVNDIDYPAEDNNPFTIKISPTSPDNYPVKYIDAWTNHDDLAWRGAVASYTFAPAAGAFSVVVTPTTAFTTKTIDGENYRLIATLSSQNGSGEVTYELDEDLNYYDLRIDGNGIYEYYEGSGGSSNNYKDGTIPEWADDGYNFNGIIPYIIATDATNAKAYANTLIPYGDEDEPSPPQPSTGGSGNSSGSSGGGSAAPSTPAPAPVDQATAVQNVKDAIAAAKNSPNGAAVTLKNVTNVSLSTLKEMAKAAGNTALKVNADSLNDDGSVDVRITLDPSKATNAMNLAASTSSIEAVTAKVKFANFFNNTISTVSLSQKGSFGTPVRVAAKVDTKLNPDTLVFYAYDSATNTYTKIENPEYKVDKNGYVHFTTSVGGEIIISDKPLTRKK